MGYEVVQQVTVDVSRNLPAPVVFCKQADNVVRVLRVLIQDDKQDYTIPAGFTARLRGTKADGTRIYLDARSQTGNTAEFVLTQNALAAYGKAACEVELRNADDVVKTCNLVLNVQQAAMDDAAVESTDEFKSLETARAAAEAAVEKAESAAEKSAAEKEAAATSAAAAKTSANAAETAQSGAQAAQTAAETSAAEAEATRKEIAEIAVGKVPVLTDDDIAEVLDVI